MNFRIALRYVFSKTNGNRRNSFFMIAGIGVTLACMLAVLSMVNGLQSEQLDVMRDLKSFDLIVDNTSLTPEEVAEINGVGKAFYFRDFDVLISNGSRGKSLSGRVRAIDISVYDDSDNIYFYSSGKETAFPSGMLNGLSLIAGEEAEITFLKKGKTNLLTPYNLKVVVENVFNSRLAEFNTSLVMVSPETVSSVAGEKDFRIGIYCNGDVEDLRQKIQSIDVSCKITDWKDSNSTLYSALVLEKRIVSYFLFLICMVVCLNLKTSTQRLVELRKKDGGILRLLGFTRRRTNSVFIIYGFMLFLAGEILGIILALLFTDNIQPILNAADFVLSMFGKNLFLSSFPIDFRFAVKETIVTCVLLSVSAFLLVLSGCRKIFTEDISKVVINASY